MEHNFSPRFHVKAFTLNGFDWHLICSSSERKKKRTTTIIIITWRAFKPIKVEFTSWACVSLFLFHVLLFSLIYLWWCWRVCVCVDFVFLHKKMYFIWFSLKPELCSCCFLLSLFFVRLHSSSSISFWIFIACFSLLCFYYYYYSLL